MNRRLKGSLARERRFWESLSLRSRFLFVTAIFFTFGTVGFVQDLFDLRTLTRFPVVIAAVIISGLFSVGIALSVATSRWLVAPTVALMVLASRVGLPALSRALGETPVSQVPMEVLRRRIELDGMLLLAFITMSYMFWVWLIAGEGARKLRLQTEVGLAERLHATLVPPIERRGARLEIYGRSEPSSEVGGDLLDVVERDGETVLFVADVSGHGVSAGAFMGMTKSAIRMKLLASPALDVLLDDLDDVVAQVRSPEMFVTFAAIRFDASNTAELALAGHLPILHGRRASGAIEAIDNRFPPLGVAPQRGHTSTRVAFERGDLFVILTDGLTEVANRRGEQLGVDGIIAVLAPLLERPLAEIYAAVLAAARAHGAQTDDQTLLLARVV